eukprot:g75279.t1
MADLHLFFQGPYPVTLAPGPVAGGPTFVGRTSGHLGPVIPGRNFALSEDGWIFSDCCLHHSSYQTAMEESEEIELDDSDSDESNVEWETIPTTAVKKEEKVKIAKREPRKRDPANHYKRLTDEWRRQNTWFDTRIKWTDGSFEEDTVRPRITEVWASMSLGCPLKLLDVAINTANVEYDRRVKKAIEIRTRRPPTIAKISEEGQVRLMGCETEAEARMAGAIDRKRATSYAGR